MSTVQRRPTAHDTSPGAESVQLHAGQEPVPGRSAHVVPIDPSARYTGDEAVHGANLAFCLAGEIEVDRGVAGNVELGRHLPTVGDGKSLVTYRAVSTTLQQLAEEGKECSTGPPDRARSSVGGRCTEETTAVLGCAVRALCRPSAV